MADVLIVANQTLCSDELIAAVLVRNAAGECSFRILVPATPLNRQEQALRHSEHPGAVFGESGPVAVGRMRLHQAQALLADANIEAPGDVGDPDPYKAVVTAAEYGHVDEVIMGTLPDRRSHWITRDVPGRLRRRLGVPVTHVETGRISGRRDHTPAPAPTRSPVEQR